MCVASGCISNGDAICKPALLLMRLARVRRMADKNVRQPDEPDNIA